jgi:hypothetical protein
VIVWVLIGVGAVTAVVALVLVATLLRRLKALSEAVAELQEALLPVLEEIRRGSEEAQGRMIRLEERRAAMETGPVGG